MSTSEEEAVILVKAVPRPSRRHGETVCCAGVTRDGQWRRLYPIRFRLLKENRFHRWQFIRYRWRRPRSDLRRESRHVFEDTIRPGKDLPKRKRPDFVQPLVVGSAERAAQRGDSLALVRPRESRFRWRRKSESAIESERRELQAAAHQTSLFDKELAVLEPSPYDFRLSFRDEDGWHHHQCSDWETTATFWRQGKTYGEEEALRHLNKMYNEFYPASGMVLALGNMARRPRTWLLLGVIRVDEPEMGSLF